MAKRKPNERLEDEALLDTVKADDAPDFEDVADDERDDIIQAQADEIARLKRELAARDDVVVKPRVLTGALPEQWYVCKHQFSPEAIGKATNSDEAIRKYYDRMGIINTDVRASCNLIETPNQKQLDAYGPYTF